MSFSVKRINETFVGEVEGVNIADDHSAEEITQIREALLEHGILVFHDQVITNEEHVRFSQKFGLSEIHTVKQIFIAGFSRDYCAC